MKSVIILFVLVGGSIALSAWSKKKSFINSQAANNDNDLDNGSSDRKCLNCGFEGGMKTWIPNYKAPKFYFVLGFICGYIPGLIFLALYWGKYKCPKCGAVGRNKQIVRG